jgi:hypothetical protein
MLHNARKTRQALLLTAATGLVGGLTMLGTATAEAQTSSLCNFEVRSLTAWELQDGNGDDEIGFRLGDDTYGKWTFWDNWTRNNSLGYPDEDYSGTVTFSLYEYDGVLRTTIDSDTVACTVGTHTMDLSGHGAIYELEYRVTN